MEQLDTIILAILGATGLWGVINIVVNKLLNRGVDEAKKAHTYAETSLIRVDGELRLASGWREYADALEGKLEKAEIRLSLLEKTTEQLKNENNALVKQMGKLVLQNDELMRDNKRLHQENKRLLTENKNLRVRLDSLEKKFLEYKKSKGE